MDPNTQTPTSNPQVVNPLPQAQPVVPQPVTPQSQSQPVAQMPPQQGKGSSKKIFKLLLVVFILVILSLGGFLAYSYFNSQEKYNAGVYNYPTPVPATPTPTDVLNPNDTSDSSIDNNNQIVDKSLNDLNADLNSVNDSLNDKQTNLQ